MGGIFVAATAQVFENTVTGCHVGIMLQPSANAVIKANRIARNQKGVQLSEETLEAIVEEGGFGRISSWGNTYEDNRDSSSDETFIKSLEVLLHPLLRRLYLGVVDPCQCPL